ncbi:MAG: trypsin-like serine protease [Anaerolineae bacterium]|nr:trypsin-like serine protease [Anaerolineae bacterium]
MQKISVRSLGWGLLLVAVVAMLLLVGQPAQAQEPVQGKDDMISVQIVGGQDADPNEWPWQVRITIPIPEKPGFISVCGGTLITNEWVLTAAHCIQSNGVVKPATGIRAVLGEHNTAGNEGAEQERDVAQVIAHPNYNERTKDNDVALLRLSAVATLNDQVKTIILNRDAAVPIAGTTATVTGWGALRSGGPSPNILQEVNVPVVSNQTCNGPQSYGGGITENMICAGFPQGGKDSCQGDSGGPLVIPDGNGGWTHIGVVSFGRGCASANFYGVYARTSQYINWIETNIGTTLPTGGGPPPAPQPDTNLLKNPGFEATSDWTEFSSNNYTLIGSPNIPARGTRSAWLAGADSETSRVSQVINPPTTGILELNFFYQIRSSDTNCGNDKATVKINNKLLQTFNLCQGNSTTNWRQLPQAINVSEFIGQQITLVFESTTDNSGTSNFYVDDVSLIYKQGQPQPPPVPPPTGNTTLPNGDFEQGKVTWTENSSSGFSVIQNSNLPVQPLSGAYVAMMGSADNEQSSLSQQYTVPAGANLVFSYQVLSKDFCGYDSAVVKAGQTTLATIELCAAQQTGTWQRRTLSLNNITGNTTLSFEVTTDESTPSTLLIDNVDVVVGTPAPAGDRSGSPFQLQVTPGNDGIKLDWTAAPDSDVVSYKVLRKLQGAQQSTPFNEVGTATRNSFLDPASGLMSDQGYLYRVQALDAQGTVKLETNIVEAQLGLNPELEIPQLSVYPDQEFIEVPVYINGARGLRIVAAEILIEYDASIINLTDAFGGPVFNTPLTEEYDWIISDPEPVPGTASIERVIINLENFFFDPTPINGDGSFFTLDFAADGTAGTRTTIDLVESLYLRDGSTLIILDENDEEQELLLTNLTDGGLLLTNEPRYQIGDVNGDVDFDAADIETLLDIAIGKSVASQAQIYAGDMNGNNELDSSDAAILNFFLTDKDFGDLFDTDDTPQSIRLSLGDIEGDPGQVATTSIRAMGLVDFAAGDFVVIYNTELIESVTAVAPTALTSDFDVAFYDNGEGLVRIALAKKFADDSPAITGNGNLLTLSVQLKDVEASTLESASARMALADATLYTPGGLNVEENIYGSTIDLQSGTVTVGSGDTVYLPIVIK